MAVTNAAKKAREPREAEAAEEKSATETQVAEADAKEANADSDDPKEVVQTVPNPDALLYQTMQVDTTGLAGGSVKLKAGNPNYQGEGNPNES